MLETIFIINRNPNLLILRANQMVIEGWAVVGQIKKPTMTCFMLRCPG